MTRPIHSVAVLAALAVLAGCAQRAPEPPAGAPLVSNERQCFFPRQITGYSEAPDGPTGADRLFVSTGGHGRYLLETFGTCSDLDWSLSIALDTRFTTGSLCTGDTVTVLVPRSAAGGPDRCTARILGRVVEPR